MVQNNMMKNNNEKVDHEQKEINDENDKNNKKEETEENKDINQDNIIYLFFLF